MKQTHIFAWRWVLAALLTLTGARAALSQVTAVGKPLRAPSGMPDDIGTALPCSAALAAGADNDASLLEVRQPCPPEPCPASEPCPMFEPIAPPTDPLAVPCMAIQSTWYTRFDYFQWGTQERNDQSLSNDYGTLYTIGCLRRTGPERLRIELFGGDMISRFASDDPTDPYKSDAKYLGIRAEYEYIWPFGLTPDLFVDVFVGIGTRAWIKDIKDMETGAGDWVEGWQETWWTVYPYVGMEKSWPLESGREFYATGHIGFTLWTYERDSIDNAPTFYPQPNINGQVELGFRQRSLFLAAYFEAITWSASNSVHRGSGYWYYGQSEMYLTGLKFGWTF